MFQQHKRTFHLPTSAIFFSCLKGTYFFLEAGIYTELGLFFFLSRKEKRNTLRKTQLSKPNHLDYLLWRERTGFIFVCVRV